MEDFEEKFRRREGIGAGPELTSEQAAEFKREATERYAEYISQLDAPDLRGSDLRNARMSGTFLPGANLRKVEMQGANLRNADVQGAYLISADMSGADCSITKQQTVLSLRGALLHDANVSCDSLTQTQLDGAVRNSRTILPRGGFTVASCLKTVPKVVEMALAHHPEVANRFRFSRAELRNTLLCNLDGTPHAIEIRASETDSN
jgi:uncharacterized protein YjbI with pentapeptide repeats